MRQETKEFLKIGSDIFAHISDYRSEQKNAVKHEQSLHYRTITASKWKPTDHRRQSSLPSRVSIRAQNWSATIVRTSGASSKEYE